MNIEINNDKLKMLMIELSLQNNPELLEEFTTTLMDSVFIAPIGKGENIEDEINLYLLTNDKGENYFQAYTDNEAFLKHPDNKEYDTVNVSFTEFVHIIMSNNATGLVINPFTENISLTKENLEEIYNSNKVGVELFDKDPEETKDIIKVLKKYKDITKAYIFKIHKKNNLGMLLVIDKDDSKLFEKLGKELETKNILVDIAYLNNDVIKEFIDNLKAKPFYKKEK